jgi:hypothetical protein
MPPANVNIRTARQRAVHILPPAGDLFYRDDMSSQDEFDEPSVICADANEPGLLYAFIDQKLSARIAGSIAEIDRAHGHGRFRGNDGKPLSSAVSIKTPLKDALINGFEVIDDISAYDQWIAVLEEAATFLRSEKARFENEIATATCSGCGHALAAHLHARSAELDCMEPGCACLQFRPEMLEAEAPRRVLRLIRGGKLPGNR